MKYNKVLFLILFLAGTVLSCQKEYLDIPVFITINDAIFIPPIQSSIDELMGDLEKFAHDLRFYPDLLKIALIHYQFETIHPFLDGNGRVGRLMITLYLVEKEILKKPILYISDFFEKNRQLYYDNLMNARLKNDLKQWLKFFLVGIQETAQNGIDTFDAILKLQKELNEKIKSKGRRSVHFFKLLEYLYKDPIIINPNQLIKLLGVSIATAYKIIDDMVTMGVLKEITGGKRNTIYIFQSCSHDWQ